jgi:hypothetical protein
MIYESQVVDAVEKFLRHRSYVTILKSPGQKSGYDLVMDNEVLRRRLCIEAKGGTSSLPSSKRYTMPFDRKQCLSHASQAFYRAASMKEHAPSEYPSPDFTFHVAMAFANSPDQRFWIDKIQQTITQLEIGVFWVDRDFTVTFVEPWNLNT